MVVYRDVMELEGGNLQTRSKPLLFPSPVVPPAVPISRAVSEKLIFSVIGKHTGVTSRRGRAGLLPIRGVIIGKRHRGSEMAHEWHVSGI
jgi:hypothetical protein